MSKKINTDPKIRQILLLDQEMHGWNNLPLNDLIDILQKVKDTSLEADPGFSDFRVKVESDEYECHMEIWGTRPENPAEKTERLALAKYERNVKKKAAADRRELELSELKRLCKRLKIASPI